MRTAPVSCALLLLLVACATPASPPRGAAGPDLVSAAAFVDSFITSLAHPADSGHRAPLDTVDFVWARSGALLDADSLGALLAAQRAARKAIVLGSNDVKLTPLGPYAVV